MTCRSLDVVLSQHMTEAMSLEVSRRSLVKAPHASVFDLRRLDERLESHLDGLLTAGPRANRYSDAALATRSKEAAFVAFVIALRRGDFAGIQAINQAVEELRNECAALTSAFEWVGRHRLQGIVRDLLQCADPTGRLAGIAACAMHRVDPGLETGPWLADEAAAVRARALRAVGELGLLALAPRCAATMSDEDSECRFWAAWSMVLLGNRDGALNAVSRIGLDREAPHRARAFRLMLQAMDTPDAHATLQALARDPAQRPSLVQGSGIVGDVTYVPWLLGHMASADTARAAGEAFTLITGADLDAQQLWRPQPEDFESGPGDEPGRRECGLGSRRRVDVAGPAEGEEWWDANSGRFSRPRATSWARR